MKKYIFLIGIFAVIFFQKNINANEKRVMVFHCIRNKTPLSEIKKNGLLTYNEQVARGLCKHAFEGFKPLFPDQYDVIYFSPYPYELGDHMGKFDCVGFVVDPDKTYVYNRIHRFCGKPDYYYGNTMLLRDYLKHCKNGTMGSNFVPEVIIDRKQIPFSELFCLDFTNLRVPRCRL